MWDLNLHLHLIKWLHETLSYRWKMSWIMKFPCFMYRMWMMYWFVWCRWDSVLRMDKRQSRMATCQWKELLNGKLIATKYCIYKLYVVNLSSWMLFFFFYKNKFIHTWDSTLYESADYKQSLQCYFQKAYYKSTS